MEIIKKNEKYKNIKKSLSSLTKKSIGSYYYEKDYSLNIYEDGSLRFYVLNVTQYSLNNVLDKLLDLFIKNKNLIKKISYIDKLSKFKISYRSYGNEKIYIDKQVQIDINFIEDNTFFLIYHPLNKESYFGELNSDLRKEIYKIFSFESSFKNNFKKIIKNKFPKYTNKNYNNKNFLSEIFRKKNIKDLLYRPIPDEDKDYYSLNKYEDGNFKYFLWNNIPYELFLEDFSKVLDFFNKNNSKNIKNTLLNFLSSSISLTDLKYVLKYTLIYINFINNITYFSVYNVIDEKYNYINLNIDLREPMNEVYNNIKILSKIFRGKKILGSYKRSYTNGYYLLTIFEDGSLKYELLNDMPYQLLSEDLSKNLDSFNKNNIKKLLKFLSESISFRDSNSKSFLKLILYSDKYALKDTIIYINFINNNTYFSIYNVTDKKYYYIRFNLNLNEQIYKKYSSEKILNNKNSFKKIITNKFNYNKAKENKLW